MKDLAQELKQRNYFAIISVVLFTIFGAKFEAKSETLSFEEIALYDVGANNEITIEDRTVVDDTHLVYGWLMNMDGGEGDISLFNRFDYSKDYNFSKSHTISLLKKGNDGSEYWTIVTIVGSMRMVGKDPLWILSPDKKYLLSKRSSGFGLYKSYKTSSNDDKWFDNYLKTKYNYRGDYRNTKEYKEFINETDILADEMFNDDLSNLKSRLEKIAPLIVKLSKEYPEFTAEYKENYAPWLIRISLVSNYLDIMEGTFNEK